MGTWHAFHFTFIVYDDDLCVVGWPNIHIVLCGVNVDGEAVVLFKAQVLVNGDVDAEQS